MRGSLSDQSFRDGYFFIPRGEAPLSPVQFAKA
jgi:hypothetical protein